MLCACGVLIKQKTGIGRSMTSRTKTAYVNDIEELTGIPSVLLYVPDSNNRIRFIRETLVEQNRIPLFGIYAQGELIAGSQTLNEKSGCISKLTNCIDSALAAEDVSATTIRAPSVFADYKISPLIQSKQGNMLDQLKPISIVLVYSYGFGNFYNSFYRDVVQRVQTYEDQCQLFVITIDQIHSLPD